MSTKQGALESLFSRPQPSASQQFFEQPYAFLVTKLYKWRQSIVQIPQPARPVSVVCISDTHNTQPQDIPNGDILIHAGDITNSGTLGELQQSLAWIKALPHPSKIVIAGNHDIVLDHTRQDAVRHEPIDWGDVIYLNSESTTISCSNNRHLKVYGSPLTPIYGNWPFQYPRDEDVWEDQIPADTDILITHGPPKAHLDNHNGCKHLLAEMWRRSPMLHVFGHSHAGYGVEWAHFDRLQKIYEDTVVSGGGFWNLVQAVVLGVCAWLGPRQQAKACLVNAAIVGGIRDEQRRRPIVVRV